MIPLRDTITSKNYPVVNNAIIGINIAVFLMQLFQGQNLYNFDYLYGLVPARYSIPRISSDFTATEQIFPFISFMFLHGGFLHVLGNMWTLYIFGDNVEDHMGPFRYLIFYLACGLISGLTHLSFNFYSNFPTIGASGAIAGVMGAYFILYPNAKILTLIPIIIIPWIIEIPAFFFLIFWFLLQILNAAGSSGQAGGIAWWAHIGGFIFGMIWIKMSSFVPETGLTGITRHLTGKKKSHRLQVIRPVSTGNDGYLYGILQITPYEAAMGTQKIVSISHGFKKKFYKVVVPAGVSEGSILRLKGFSYQAENGLKGDLFLKMVIEE
ncbi:MAG: rhomboid family intramembrane serine protease [Desulfobacterium sp.]|nr:rhomboid family intramembrane serine protease [Desulfobacterium sp.]MBU3947179.1 rhomboid family intramembrane serine protease [Pseudomonadota bacterium]MBU4035367.1 rhomboid family intramembrane serine protease [Pseudomonadota bacterium]